MKEKATTLLNYLRQAYPDATCSLHYRNEFQFLIAVILSAQCTDKRVNMVCETLFDRLATPEDFSSANIETLMELIKPCGLYKSKGKNIKDMASKLLSDYSGHVPNNISELMTLPGVGKKTANVVMNECFEVTGIAVDTHVKRICRKVGLTKNTDPEKVEEDLKLIFDKSDWRDLTHLVIYFGRDICTARNPKCNICGIKTVCELHSLGKVR